jgi:tRNA G18 (ribose-2'-O)-methylase SpoU
VTRAAPIAIDDPADPRLADYHLLNDQAARRHHEGDDFFIAEGYVAIDRVIDSGHRIRSVLLRTSRVDRLLDRDGFPDVPTYVVDPEVMTQTVGFDLHRGVLASVWRRPLLSVPDLAESSRRIAVLEALNDAENVGLIARTARALGIEGLVLDPTCTDPYARRTVRVSMGEILHLSVARAEAWPDDLTAIADAGFETWALTPGGDDDIWALSAPERLAVVLGAEGPGLSENTISRCTRRVRIPIDELVDSLNVGHAAAIAFAAASRPRAGDAS